MNILIIHSSSELYGSDRSLLDFVKHRPPDFYITVALPEHGELVPALKEYGASVVVGEVCKIQRGMLSPLGLLRTLSHALRSIRFLSKIKNTSRFDLVYSNTVAVLGGALCARIWGLPHVWHVREILTGSAILTSGFRRMVALLSSTVICNSGQTEKWIRLAKSSSKYHVIWNGFDPPTVQADRQHERQLLGASPNDVLFVLVGRINAWKGHKLLVDAFADLARKGVYPQARLAIVGSAPTGQDHYESELAEHIAKSNCSNQISMLPYRSDIESVWIAADVVVVPSTDPEPFGRVAIEAMGFSKPVIAAAHGGLVEIVKDNETGLLFEPRDVGALTNAISMMLADIDLRLRLGKAGQARQRMHFSSSSYASNMASVLKSFV